MSQSNSPTKNTRHSGLVPESTPPSSTPWIYSEAVKDHFLSPRNYLVGDPAHYSFDAQGLAGNPICGDEMLVYLKIENGPPGTGPAPARAAGSQHTRPVPIIKDIKWKTYGCASAIASTSALSELAKGKPLSEALAITPEQIADYLGGLPQHKFHCSVLGQEALRAAIENYQKSQK